MKSEESADDFKVIPIGELFKRYYSPDEKPPPIKLDPQKVPQQLRHLIPLAERWGISDDLLRAQAVKNADPTEIEELRQTVSQYNHHLDGWLAGPESYSRSPSAEYLAFANMLMAADGC